MGGSINKDAVSGLESELLICFPAGESVILINNYNKDICYSIFYLSNHNYY